MFTRTIIGSDIVYKKEGEIFAAVLNGALVSQITGKDHEAHLRYLVVNHDDAGTVKEKQLNNLVAMAKAKDGIHSLVKMTKYRFHQHTPKNVSLFEI